MTQVVSHLLYLIRGKIVVVPEHVIRGRFGGTLKLIRLKLKPKYLLFIRKFVSRMKDSKRKIVNCQIFEKAANLGAYKEWPEFEEKMFKISADKSALNLSIL